MWYAVNYFARPNVPNTARKTTRGATGSAKCAVRRCTGQNIGSAKIASWRQKKMKQWKEVKGYEGLYLVSDSGDVVSVTRGLKIPQVNEDGYLRVQLCKGGVQKNYYVHRLVAEAFIENPQGLPIINHRDENKMNNVVDNLEWCTNLYNNTYGTRMERVANARKDKRTVAILQFDIDGKFVRRWDGVYLACRELGVCKASVHRCIRGKQNTAGGFRWVRAV